MKIARRCRIRVSSRRRGYRLWLGLGWPRPRVSNHSSGRAAWSLGIVEILHHVGECRGGDLEIESGGAALPHVCRGGLNPGQHWRDKMICGNH